MTVEVPAPAVYRWLEVIITLRCNAMCMNCLRLCNAKWSGMDYKGLDMSEGQFDRVLDDVLQLAHSAGQPAFDVFSLTGGEPLLHPLCERFLWRAIHTLEAVAEPAVGQIVINTNNLIPAPPWAQPCVVHWGDVGYEKAMIHDAAFVDPTESGEVITRDSCTHFRKHPIVVTSQGYSRCCAADGYTRLFAADDLILDHLPERDEDWPNMDRICAHCAFGASTRHKEYDVGMPISPIYREQARLNLEGRKVLKVLPSKDRG